jgi:XTP/dITP diphosphohydrolase
MCNIIAPVNPGFLLTHNLTNMQQTYIIATNNKHKVEEIKAILGNSFELKTLADINCFDEIPEEQDTLEGNAIQKAQYIYEKFGFDCFADDTGLEVEALNGKPGVYSARYSVDILPDATNRAEANIEKLLNEMRTFSNRNANFRTVICLIQKGKQTLFEGRVNGSIIFERKGIKGFGYDPVFIPKNQTLTFAELSLEEKNKISHRAMAVTKLCEFLKG